MTSSTILQIDQLKMYFKTQSGYVRSVDDVSLTLPKKTCLGLVGESGCGKTTLMKALLKILPPTCHHQGGSITFDGTDITDYSYKQMQPIRWNRISMISQSAMNALDPAYRIGSQIVETIRIHRKKVSRKTAWEHAASYFEMVGINPERLKDYPHQFSGGMKQRAVIAMAMVLEPDIIVADEPTTALDVVIQAQILERLKSLQEKYNGSMIIVTHDISVVAQTCSHVTVMYGGKLLESGPVAQVLKEPNHPYAMGLKNAFPSLLGEKKSLISIPGSPPDLIHPPRGCRFVDRCPFEIEKCRLEEPSMETINNSQAACHRLSEAESLRKQAEDETVWLKKETL
jgi:peptide/nickel transport system ATP-binding protein